MKRTAALFLTACLLLTMSCISCGSSGKGGYTRITQEEAAQMMERDDGHVIVDVRRQDEYDSGHIPGAILLPNESIADQPPEALPDKEQIILIYCRSGNRSKQAAQKLADMGYTHIYEFGGINTWQGEIVTSEAGITADMAYEGVSHYCHTMYDWSVAEENPDIMAVTMGEETDAAYQVIFRSYSGTFVYFSVDKASGRTTMTEVVPSMNVESEAGEFSIYDYLSKKN